MFCFLHFFTDVALLLSGLYCFQWEILCKHVKKSFFFKELLIGFFSFFFLELVLGSQQNGIESTEFRSSPVAQWKWTWLVSMRIQLQSLASLSGSRIWHCRGVDCRYSSDPMFLWLWCRAAAIAPILGTSICHECGPKKLKKKKVQSLYIYPCSSHMYNLPHSQCPTP